MRHVSLFTAAGLAMLAPISATAGSTANLQVTGTITPAACSVSLGGTADVSLGTIQLSDFVAGQAVTEPDVEVIPFGIFDADAEADRWL